MKFPRKKTVFRGVHASPREDLPVMHTNTYTHTATHTHAHTHTHTDKHTNTHTDKHTNTNTHTQTFKLNLMH